MEQSQNHEKGDQSIDGAGLTESGIQVLGTAAQPVADLEISGFEVRDFQHGIVVQFATQARIRANEVHENTKWASAAGTLDQAMAIDLVTAHFSEASENIVHNNGDRGIGLRLGSTNIVLRANRIYENACCL